MSGPKVRVFPVQLCRWARRPGSEQLVSVAVAEGVPVRRRSVDHHVRLRLPLSDVDGRWRRRRRDDSEDGGVRRRIHADVERQRRSCLRVHRDVWTGDDCGSDGLEGARSDAATVGTSPAAVGRRRRLRAPLCLLYTSPSPRDRQKSRMPSSA